MTSVAKEKKFNDPSVLLGIRGEKDKFLELISISTTTTTKTTTWNDLGYENALCMFQLIGNARRRYSTTSDLC